MKNKLYCSSLNTALRRILRKSRSCFFWAIRRMWQLIIMFYHVLLETEMQLICFTCSTCRSEGCGCAGVGVLYTYKFSWFVLVCFQHCLYKLIAVGWASNCSRSQSVQEYMEQVPSLGWTHLNFSADNSFPFFFEMVGGFFPFIFMGNVKRSVLTL